MATEDDNDDNHDGGDSGDDDGDAGDDGDDGDDDGAAASAAAAAAGDDDDGDDGDGDDIYIMVKCLKCLKCLSVSKSHYFCIQRIWVFLLFLDTFSPVYNGEVSVCVSQKSLFLYSKDLAVSHVYRHLSKLFLPAISYLGETASDRNVKLLS